MNQLPVLTKNDIFSPALFVNSNSRPDQDVPAVWGRMIDQQEPLAYPLAIGYPLLSEAVIAQAVNEAVATERNRLARDLHDAVSQTLFAASLIAEVLPDLWDTNEIKARQCTEELRQLTRGAMAEMRTLLFELRPAALNQAHLSDLLKQISESITGRERLPVHLDLAGECEIPCEVKLQIYRIAQESLNNIVKYARATRVELTLRLEADSLHLEIKDDGIGFDPACVRPTSLGLRIMRERAEGIQACLQVDSQPDQGTCVRLDWYR
jgi:signal transduction histidine kinase